MLQLAPLLLVVPLLGSGTRMDVASAADVQTGAGLIALRPNEPSSLGSETTLLLLSGVRASTSRTSLELSYQPRVTLQLPNALDTLRPLLLHQLRFGYQSALSPRTRLALSLSGRAGEVSYNSQAQVFAPGSTTASARLVPLWLGAATASLSHQTSQRNVVMGGLVAEYSAPLSSSDSALSPFPESLSAGATLSDRMTVSRTDQLEFAATSQFIKTSQPGAPEELDLDAELSTFGSTVTWMHALSPATSIGATTGGSLTYSVSGGDIDAFPEGSILHSTRWRGDSALWSSTVNAGVRGFLDRIAGTYNPQGFASWAVGAEIGRSWTTGARVFGSTSLAEQPLAPAQYETFATLEQPTVFQLSPNAQLRFGLRSALRAPHHRAESKPSPATQTEITGFVGFRYGLGTDRQEGAWLQ